MVAPKVKARHPRFQDLTDKQFDYLHIIDESAKRGRCIYWRCRCVCGKVFDVAAHAVRRPGASCGCITRQKIIAACRKHGMEGSTEYQSWAQARCRCRNPKHHAYARYGGRGILFCERWDDFAIFYADMGPKPGPEYSLDRHPDNDGNYEPGNCRWATPAQQMANRANTSLVTYQGETLTLREWGRRVGIRPSTLRSRIFVHGWSAERALTTPLLIKRA